MKGGAKSSISIPCGFAALVSHFVAPSTPLNYTGET
jgi:hypothetical protein